MKCVVGHFVAKLGHQRKMTLPHCHHFYKVFNKRIVTPILSQKMNIFPSVQQKFLKGKNHAAWAREAIFSIKAVTATYLILKFTFDRGRAENERWHKNL